MKDYVKDPMILVKTQDTDAYKWAESFCDQYPSVPVDEALGWFTSAIMTEHDHIVNNRVRPLEEKREKLLSLLLLTDESVSNVEVGDTQIKQHQAFLDSFEDERELIDRVGA